MKISSTRAIDEPEIIVISLIDVLFCLILFFVFTTTFDQRSAIKLDLPEASAPEQVAPAEALIVVVDSGGRYFVGSGEVLGKDAATLKQAIAAAAGEDRERPVVLRADAKTPHQSVVTALDVLGQLGFSRISIATVAADSAKP